MSTEAVADRRGTAYQKAEGQECLVTLLKQKKYRYYSTVN